MQEPWSYVEAQLLTTTWNGRDICLASTAAALESMKEETVISWLHLITALLMQTTYYIYMYIHDRWPRTRAFVTRCTCTIVGRPTDWAITANRFLFRFHRRYVTEIFEDIDHRFRHAYGALEF